MRVPRLVLILAVLAGCAHQQAEVEPEPVTLSAWLRTLPPEKQRVLACVAAALLERGGEAPEGWDCERVVSGDG